MASNAILSRFEEVGMSIACPHRHISYSRWRLNVLSELSASQDRQRPPILQLLQPCYRTQNARTRRHYSSEQTPKGQSLSASGAKKDQRKTLATEGDATPEQIHSYTPFERTNEVGGERHTPDAPRQRPRGSFNPYTQENRRFVKDALETLSELADQGFLAEGLGRGESSNRKPLKNPFPWLEAANLPQSPILRKTRKKDIPVKEFRTPTEQPLTHDPWARMLAEPIRNCKESCVRMPKSLLSDWSFTRHPASPEEIYLMPSSLANVEEVDKLSRRKQTNKQGELERQGGEHRYAPFENDGYLDRLADDQIKPKSTDVNAAEPISPRAEPRPSASLATKTDQPGRARVVRILLYDNLLSLFSLTNLRDKKRRSFTSRLMPTLWMRRAEEARHYEQSRKDFAFQTGQQHLPALSLDATVDLNNVRWQNDIGKRLLNILRETVMYAVGQSFAQEADRQKNLTSVLPMSKVKAALDGRDEEVALISAGDMPATEMKPSDQQPLESAIDHIHLADDRALQPRFLLHLGFPGSLQDLDLPEGNDMIPPLLPSAGRGTSQRFPVFPARAMLSDSSYEKLLCLVSKKKILNEQQIKRLDLAGHDYLLMFKLSTDTEAIEGLLKALWRLWRYGGGMRWMSPDGEKYEGWKETLTELDKLLAGEKEKMASGALGGNAEESSWDVDEEEGDEVEDNATDGHIRTCLQKRRRNKQCERPKERTACITEPSRKDRANAEEAKSMYKQIYPVCNDLEGLRRYQQREF